MSKKRKRHNKAKPSGGRVTPRKARPSSSGPSGIGASALGGETPDGGILDDLLDGLIGDDPFAPTSAGSFFDELADADLPGADPLLGMVATLDHVGDDPVMVELWGASLVGGLASGLVPPSPFDAVPAEADDEDEVPDPEEFFDSLISGFAGRVGGPDGRRFVRALHAIEPYLPPAAGAKARAAMNSADRHAPTWAGLIGRGVVEEAFVVDHETDDGHNVALVARYPGTDQRFLTMVMVDQNMGGLAKDILVADAIDEIKAAMIEEQLTISELDVPTARARIDAALRMTEMTIEAPVSDDFDETLPILECLLASLPEGAELPEPEPPTSDEIDSLVESVVEATLAAGSNLDGEALAATAHLAMTYMSYRMGRDPLAWSAIRMELLLLDYVPGKVAAPPEELMGMPDELIALLPVVHERAGWERRHLDEATEAVHAAAPEFRELLASPGAGSPMKQVLMRALGEGVDLEDPAQLQALLERVNAVGGVDVFGQGDDLS